MPDHTPTRPGAAMRPALVLVTMACLPWGVYLMGRTKPWEPHRWARWAVVRAGAEDLTTRGVVLQRFANDCGPAALANLLRATGRKAPSLDSLSKLSGLRPTGTTASALVRAGEALGMELEVLRPPALTQVNPPYIAWVRQSHFVVVAARLSRDRLRILDPMVGGYTVERSRFARMWSGVVIHPVPPSTTEHEP